MSLEGEERNLQGANAVGGWLDAQLVLSAAGRRRLVSVCVYHIMQGEREREGGQVKASPPLRRKNGDGFTAIRVGTSCIWEDLAVGTGLAASQKGSRKMSICYIVEAMLFNI